MPERLDIPLNHAHIPDVTQALNEVMDTLDETQQGFDEEAKPFKTGLDKVKKKFGAKLKELKSDKDGLKQWLLDVHTQWSRAFDTALKAGEDIPDEPPWPENLVWTTVYGPVYTRSELPDRFLVVDEKALLEALKAGEDVPGASMEKSYRVSLRREKK